MVLAAAHGDPLRAMEMEEQLTEEWWTRWVAWHNATATEKKKDKDGANDESED